MSFDFAISHSSYIPRSPEMAIRKLYSYARAFQSQSEYARRMKFLSNSIFGEVRRPTSKDSMRVVWNLQRKPYNLRKEIVEYYPAHNETAELMTKLREFGLYRDEAKDFREEMERLRQARGKDKNFMAKWAKKREEEKQE